MDEIVERAMRKWPNVPNVFGWLRLDRRGQWRLKDRSGEFSTISNPAVNAFIGRNYGCDERGRCFFQNGPQRVFVSLDCAPWVWRYEDGLLRTHTGLAAGPARELMVDEQGALLLAAAPEGTALAPGVVSDRDLQDFTARLLADNPALGDEAGLLALAARGGELMVLGERVPAACVNSAALAARYGFDPDPRPAPGQPDC